MTIPLRAPDLNFAFRDNVIPTLKTAKNSNVIDSSEYINIDF